MQHPVGARVGPSGALELADAWAYLFNPWAFWQYAHTMSRRRHHRRLRRHRRRRRLARCSAATATHARIALRVGVIAGAVACLLAALPDRRPPGQARRRAPARRRSPRWRESSRRRRTPSSPSSASPTSPQHRLDNPIVVPGALSFLAYGTLRRHRLRPRRLPARPVARQRRAPLLQLSRDGRARHASSPPSCWRRCYSCGGGRLERTRRLLWVLMLALPFPYIATTAGWMTAELGRQPWLVYGLMRTADGTLAEASSAAPSPSPPSAGSASTSSSASPSSALVARQLARGPGRAGATGSSTDGGALVRAARAAC